MELRYVCRDRTGKERMCFGEGHLLRAVIALMGVVITTTRKRKKRVLSPPRQRTNHTINTFGLRVPEKKHSLAQKRATSPHLPDMGLVTSQTTSAHSGYITPASAIPAVVQAALETNIASQTLVSRQKLGS